MKIGKISWVEGGLIELETVGKLQIIHCLVDNVQSYIPLWMEVCIFVCSQVEAQEKKKKKVGRAKRRMQYNRRFVNVVATFGRKKGPNARS